MSIKERSKQTQEHLVKDCWMIRARLVYGSCSFCLHNSFNHRRSTGDAPVLSVIDTSKTHSVPLLLVCTQNAIHLLPRNIDVINFLSCVHACEGEKARWDRSLGLLRVRYFIMHRAWSSVSAKCVKAKEMTLWLIELQISPPAEGLEDFRRWRYVHPRGPVRLSASLIPCRLSRSDSPT